MQTNTFPFSQRLFNSLLTPGCEVCNLQMWQDYPAVNEVYAQFFTKEAAPARAAYQVKQIYMVFLHFDPLQSKEFPRSLYF